MRMAGAVTLGVLIIEALLVGAYALGFYWVGTWYWGVAFSAGLLLLILLPWMGELKLVFDSAGPKGAVKIGWWGRASYVKQGAQARIVVRVLGIPVRRGTVGEEPDTEAAESADEPPEECVRISEKAQADEEPPPEPPAEDAKAKKVSIWKRLDSEMIEGFCRVIGSSLGATCELVWGAEEIRVSVQDPTEHGIADQALEEVIGRRAVGPVDLCVKTGPCQRRVRAIYRIALLRVGLAGLQVLIDGRVPRLAKRMKQQKQGREVLDEDQRIIDQIVEQSKCQEDED